MDLIVSLLVGAVAGWTAGAVMAPARQARTAYVLLGAVGAVLGNWVADVLGLASEGSPARWFISFLAALVLVAAVHAVRAIRAARSV